MSETKSRPQGQIISAFDKKDLLENVELPARSTVRFSRTSSKIDEAAQEIQEGLGEIEENHIEKDDEGDPIVEVRLQETGEVVGETPIDQTEGGSRYKELDLSSIDFEEEYEIEEYEGDTPETQERVVYDDRREMIKEKGKALEDSTDIEVHPFPEEDVEEVLEAFKTQVLKEKVEKAREALGLTDEEVETLKEVFNVPDGDARLQPTDIKDIEFLFPEEF